jgi:hypothetical protein
VSSQQTTSVTRAIFSGDREFVGIHQVVAVRWTRRRPKARVRECKALSANLPPTWTLATRRSRAAWATAAPTAAATASNSIIRTRWAYVAVKILLPVFWPLPVKRAGDVECEHDADGEGNEACQLEPSTNVGAARAGGVKLTLAVSTTGR